MVCSQSYMSTNMLSISPPCQRFSSNPSRRLQPKFIPRTHWNTRTLTPVTRSTWRPVLPASPTTSPSPPPSPEPSPIISSRSFPLPSFSSLPPPSFSLIVSHSRCLPERSVAGSVRCSAARAETATAHPVGPFRARIWDRPPRRFDDEADDAGGHLLLLVPVPLPPPPPPLALYYKDPLESP